MVICPLKYYIHLSAVSRQRLRLLQCKKANTSAVILSLLVSVSETSRRSQAVSRCCRPHLLQQVSCVCRGRPHPRLQATRGAVSASVDRLPLPALPEVAAPAAFLWPLRL